MRIMCRSAFVALLATTGIAASAGPKLSGDYVESRTCSVYTGACHANGERVTEGREAMLAWRVNRGECDGQNLDGLSAVAVISGTSNLADKGCERSTVLYVDSRATGEQKDALVSALTWKYGCKLGTLKAVKSAPIEFKRNAQQYTVRVAGAAYLKTTRYDCQHCVMPHMVWYDPIVPIRNSLVAKAAVCEYKGSAELATSWLRSDENSSFVGEFAF